MERHVLFAIKPNNAFEREGWINFHLLLWKYVVWQLVQVETEDAPFKAHEVWQAAWQRFERKALALSERTKTTQAVSNPGSLQAGCGLKCVGVVR